MTITDWPRRERPRERLLAHGAAALSDAELLAVVLRTGTGGASALDVARDLLARHRGLTGVLGATGASLEQSRGLGPAKVAQLKAGVELARRMLIEEVRHGDVLTSPEAVRDYLRLSLARCRTKHSSCCFSTASIG
jgi:DNA repair protein RadC